MKLAFIGCGNMAGAIIKGITATSAVLPEDIFVFDTNTSKTQEMKDETGINIAGSAAQAAESADITVLAVKPNVQACVLKEIDSIVCKPGKTIVSIAAGKTISFIESNLSSDCAVIRVMPNINAKVGAACCAMCANEKATQEAKDFVKKVFSAVGEISELDESSFPLFGVIAGCAPAFSYMFIDAIARAGVKNGMSKDLALKFAAQTVMGSAKMVLESGEHPYKLTDMVCSPGGTTIEGVLSLQADGFENTVHNAVNKAVEKDKLL